MLDRHPTGPSSSLNRIVRAQAGLARLLLGIALASSLGCSGGPRGQTGANAASQAMVVVATERAPGGGGRLVSVAQNGDRLHVLTQGQSRKVYIDRSPEFTPDGKMLFFASNRSRSRVDTTSLWTVGVSGGEPVRITQGEYSDRDPRVSPDGRWLYFCSDREGRFQLYRAQITADSSLQSIEQIPTGEGEVLSPSVSPDGQELVYMHIDAEGDSALWKVDSDGKGQPEQLTQGPLDMAPSWGRSGAIAYSTKGLGRPDADLYLLVDGESQLVVNSPTTDELGARWSRDGRYLFAIGMYRSAVDGKPLLGSLVFVDMQEETRVLRVLQDSSAVESRIGLAIFPDFFDPSAMRKNPEYHEALRKVMLQEALRNEAPLQAK
ncbi:MAG: PD40 domain-containing protein [Kofleriaceae bacterium]|nr:PD40 domain-containing protein [Kofleriaceae bacterium]